MSSSILEMGRNEALIVFDRKTMEYLSLDVLADEEKNIAVIQGNTT